MVCLCFQKLTEELRTVKRWDIVVTLATQVGHTCGSENRKALERRFLVVLGLALEQLFFKLSVI